MREKSSKKEEISRKEKNKGKVDYMSDGKRY